jgi:lipopolysaccharide/colanic/teichoic acid biosynthesis glycosyltransferase
MTAETARGPRWEDIARRTLDILGAALVLLLTLPALLILALWIRHDSPGPALLRQERIGLGARPFVLYKFRSMRVGGDDSAHRRLIAAELRGEDTATEGSTKLEDDPRITRAGRFLRSTSIDEVPQLLNVLKGDMSLVGPRPLPVDESAACERWQKQRLDVTPGLTCIWQVAGRNQVTFAEWVRMDVAYMRRRTIFHDLSILIRTIPAVLLRKGAK